MRFNNFQIKRDGGVILVKNGTKHYFGGAVQVKGQSLAGPRTVFSALWML